MIQPCAQSSVRASLAAVRNPLEAMRTAGFFASMLQHDASRFIGSLATEGNDWVHTKPRYTSPNLRSAAAPSRTSLMSVTQLDLHTK